MFSFSLLSLSLKKKKKETKTHKNKMLKQSIIQGKLHKDTTEFIVSGPTTPWFGV